MGALSVLLLAAARLPAGRWRAVIARSVLACALSPWCAPAAPALADDAPDAHAVLAREGAHAGQVRVRVRERGSGLPVTDALTVAGRAVVPDEDGRLWLRLPPGRHTLTVTGPGHAPHTLTVQVSDGPAPADARARRRAPDELEVWLTPVEVVVVTTPVDPDVPGDTRLSHERLRSVPGSLGDPLRVLESLPGVARMSPGDPGLAVRGAETTHTPLRIDGLPVPWVFHWFLARSVVDPSLLDDLRLRPGGMSAEVGGAAQGVLDVEIADRVETRGVHGRVAFDLLDASAAVRARLGRRWHLFTGARFTVLPTAVATVAKALRRPLPTPGYFDYTARLVGDLGQDELTLTVLGAGDWFQQPVSGVRTDDRDDDADAPPPDPERRLGRSLARGYHRGQLRWRRHGTWGHQETWVAGGTQHDESRLDGFGPDLQAEGPQQGRIEGWVAALRHDHTRHLSARWDLRFGVDADVERATAYDFSGYADADTGLYPRDAFWVATVSPWLATRFTSPRVVLDLGMRGSWHHLRGREGWAPEPRGKLTVRLPREASVSLFAGGYSQRPPSWRVTPLIGRRDAIDVVRSWQAGIGGRKAWSGGISLEVTAYGTWFPSVVTKDVRAELTPVAAPHQRGTPVEHWRAVSVVHTYGMHQGAAVGADLLVRAERERWFGWVALTAGHAGRWDDEARFPADRDQPLASTLVLGFRPPRRWELSGRLRVAAGQPYTPEHALYQPALLAWQGAPGDRNAARLPWFHQLDVRVAKTWLARRSTWTLALDVFNATHANNPLRSTYDPTWSDRVTTFWLPIFPNLSVAVEF